MQTRMLPISNHGLKGRKMRFSNASVPSVVVAVLAISGALSQATAGDTSTDPGKSRTDAPVSAAAAEASPSGGGLPSVAPVEIKPVRSIVGKLWRDGKPQPMDHAKYYSSLQYSGVDRFQAVVNSVGQTIGVGVQTPAAPTKDAKAQPPATPRPGRASVSCAAITP